MPGKLKVVVGLLGLGLVLHLVSGALFSAAVQGALLFGVLIGNDGVRTLLRVLAGVNIAVIFVTAGPDLQHGDPTLLAAVCVGVGVAVFIIWALGQQDVREWMFRKNFKLGDPPGPGDPPAP
jgi:hypothetical protein